MKMRMLVGLLSIGVLALAASIGRAQNPTGGQGLNDNPNSVDTTQPSTTNTGTTDTTSPSGSVSNMDRSSVSGLSDREIAGKVRRSIQDDQTLAPSAHDVKVSASNGRVMLKGKVGSDADKDMIGSKAAEIVGSGNVDNQLTVK